VFDVLDALCSGYFFVGTPFSGNAARFISCFDAHVVPAVQVSPHRAHDPNLGWFTHPDAPFCLCCFGLAFVSKCQLGSSSFSLRQHSHELRQTSRSRAFGSASDQELLTQVNQIMNLPHEVQSLPHGDRSLRFHFAVRTFGGHRVGHAGRVYGTGAVLRFNRIFVVRKRTSDTEFLPGAAWSGNP
jgi:hypothetical protein